MQKLIDNLNELESNISNFEKHNEKVSTSTVGWQIDHCLLVINGIVSQLQNSNPSSFKPNFNFKRVLVFTLKKIPRGKAKAPKSVQPKDEITLNDLLEKLEIAKIKINDLPKLNPKSHFKHPYFGVLNLKQTILFLEIHTFHHLKIVRDIVG